MLRKKILEAAKYTCSHCHQIKPEKELVIHHISEFETTVYCESCHRETHAKPRPFLTAQFYMPRAFLTVWDKFKSIAKREGASSSDLIREFIARYVMVHEPGNPQLMLQSFIGKPEKQCFFCQTLKQPLVRTRFRSGLVAEVCPTCLREKEAKGLVKSAFTEQSFNPNLSFAKSLRKPNE